MIPLTFEEAIGYFGVYVFVLCVCISMIVALYHLAELVEEHLKTTKKVVLYTIQGSLAVLCLLWVLEGVDLLTMLPTLGAQLGYWRVVHRRFPFLSIKDPLMLLSACMTIASHVAWMNYHMRTFHHISVVLGFFFIVVWLVPFQILISLAANENCLPGAASGMPADFYATGGGGDAAGGSGAVRGSRGRGGGKATRTLLGSFFESIKGAAGSGSRSEKASKTHSW